MSEYTPTTEQVRDTWTFALLEGMASAEEVNDCNWELPRRAAQLNRWLAEVERAAAEKAWEKGYDAGCDDSRGPLPFYTITPNPYRREETE